MVVHVGVIGIDVADDLESHHLCISNSSQVVAVHRATGSAHNIGNEHITGLIATSILIPVSRSAVWIRWVLISRDKNCLRYLHKNPFVGTRPVPGDERKRKRPQASSFRVIIRTSTLAANVALTSSAWSGSELASPDSSVRQIQAYPVPRDCVS